MIITATEQAAFDSRLIVQERDSCNQRTMSSLRLFWPKANDGRRAVVGESPKNGGTDQTYTSEVRFVHVSLGDVEMYRRLTAADRKGQISTLLITTYRLFEVNTISASALPTLIVAIPWNTRKLEVGHRELLHYCNKTPCSVFC